MGAILGGLSVVLGAIGAHALKSSPDPEAFSWWSTAVQFQMWHALAILAIGLARLAYGRLPAVLLLVGTLVFCATLYAMALGGPHWLGAVTPLGGLAMIAGWFLLAWRAMRLAH